MYWKLCNLVRDNKSRMNMNAIYESNSSIQYSMTFTWFNNYSLQVFLCDGVCNWAMFSYQLNYYIYLLFSSSSLVKSTAQEDRQQQNFEPEVKTVKVKTTAAPKAAAQKRFGGHKSSTNVKTPVQDDNHAQTIEEQPASKTFKRSNRFSAARQN